MPNICRYEILVRGSGKAAELIYASAPSVEEKEILKRSGTGEACELWFRGSCNWSVNHGVNDQWDADLTGLETMEAPALEALAASAETVSLRKKSGALNCEILVHSWSGDSGFDQFDQYRNGDLLHSETVECAFSDGSGFDWDTLSFKTAPAEPEVPAGPEAPAEPAEPQAPAAPPAPKSKAKLLIAAAAVVVCLIAAAVISILYVPPVRDSFRYSGAVKQMERGEYDTANQAFLELGEYKDSAELAQEALYRKAGALLEAGAFEEASTQFTHLGKYKDSPDMISECTYRHADALEASGDYAAAITKWQNVRNYSDSKDRIAKAREAKNAQDYQQAQAQMAAGNYAEAAVSFKKLSGYSDSGEQYKEAMYQNGCQQLKQKQYEGAFTTFKEILKYSDAEAKYKEALYMNGLERLEAKDYKTAVSCLEKADDYPGAAEKLSEARYHYGRALTEEGNFKYAAEILSKCADFEDAAQLCKDAKYQYVLSRAEDPDELAINYALELKNDKYPDPEEVYKKLFAWHVEITGFSDDSFEFNVIKEKIGRPNIMFFFIKVTGGEPGKKANFRAVIACPGGEHVYISFPNCESDLYYQGYITNSNAQYSLAGYIIITIYDSMGNAMDTVQTYFG